MLHKYHPQPTDADNDLFFVLGQVPGGLAEPQRSVLETQAREHLRQTRVEVCIQAKDLSLVQYTDPALPPESSTAWPLPQLTAAALAQLLADADVVDANARPAKSS